MSNNNSAHIDKALDALDTAKVQFNAAKRSFNKSMIEPKSAAEAYAKRIDDEIKQIDDAIKDLKEAKTTMEKNDKDWNVS